MQEKKKDLPNQPQTIKKMEIGTYVSIRQLQKNQSALWVEGGKVAPVLEHQEC